MLMLRGVIVKGKLDFQPRFEINNFTKRLPLGDILPRAVGLQSTYKGIRLIIENELAAGLFKEIPEWSTEEGFILNLNKRSKKSELLMRICPTPEGKAYEFLLFWSIPAIKLNLDEICNSYDHLSQMIDQHTKVHYQETLNLIARSRKRKNFFSENTTILI
jgi:hypothetical protein